MIVRNIPDFDIRQIAGSGQCFRFRKTGQGQYTLIAGGRFLTLTQQDSTVSFACTEEEFDTIWRSYFDLDTDYGRFKQAVAKRDSYLQAAVTAGYGIRILRQELWETIVCFIISQQNNIPRITKCVENLCLLFGDAHLNANEETYHSFPPPQHLASLTLEDLAPVRLGYRAKYILSAARQVSCGEVNLEDIRRMKYAKAKAALLTITGVGVKVAECICLYALHHIDAFPVDTHIRQMLDNHYPKGFPLSRYKGFAGVMQQYAFYYELGKS